MAKSWSTGQKNMGADRGDRKCQLKKVATGSFGSLKDKLEQVALKVEKMKTVEYYHNHTGQSSDKSIDRQEQIAERRAQMPRSYRATYDRAVEGKSLRAAINSFCLECVCWQIDEVRKCTDLACPLYAVRPYQRSSQNGHDGGFTGAESKKLGQGDKLCLIKKKCNR